MTDQFVRLADDTANLGKRLDMEEVVVNALVVQRERMQLAGAGAVEIARIMNSAPAGTEYGLVVRIAGSLGTVNQGTAAAHANRWPVGLSDGAAFYNAPTSSQFPAALVGGRLDVNAGAYGGAATTLGQKIMASSEPVVIASDQTVIPISDNAGSLTVDAPVTTPVAVRGSTGAVLYNLVAAQTEDGIPSFSGVVAMGEFDDITPTGVTEDSTGYVRITAKRAFHVNLRDVAGNDIGTVATPIRTDTTGTTIQPVSGAITIQATAASPASVRLSDGVAFYDGTKTGQLPTALVGGRLDANIGAWLGSIAPTVGQKPSVSSIPVVISSDQTQLSVSGSLADDAAYLVGFDFPFTIAGLADEVTPDSVNEGDIGAVRMSLNRNLYVQLRDVTAERSATVLIAAPASGEAGLVVRTVGGTTAALADFIKITDGTDTALVTAGGLLQVDASGVAVPVTDNASSLTVDAPVATPVAARLSDGVAFLTTAGGRLSVDGSGVTQPISGTVTANIGNQAKTILRANIDFVATGDNTIVAADVTNKIKVLAYSFVVGAASNLRWKSAATSISGLMNFGANMGMIQPYPSTPDQNSLQTAVNEALIINQSGTAQVGGYIIYYKEP